MAITAVNPTYVTQGPAFTGQILAGNALTETELAIVGTTTLTLDGTATTIVVPFIDGVQALTFIPTGVIAQVVGGTGTVGVLLTTVTTALNFTITLTGAGTAAATSKVIFIAVK